MSLPLENIRVLDFTRALSGPWGTMMLSDLGAEILKVEHPTTGDEAREYGPPFIEGESSYFMMFNRNKKSVTIDIRLPEGRQMMHDLARQVDVLIHNFRPPFVQKHGLAYDVLEEINPALVYCWITGFGGSGPYEELLGYDLTVMGIGGAMSMTGEPGRPPIKSAISYGDILGGYNAAVGILAALVARQETGRGQKIDINLLDGVVATTASPMSFYFATGSPPPRNAPDIGAMWSPAGTYPTSDGYINFDASRQNKFPLLCQVLGLEHLITDPRFAQREERVANRLELRPILEDRLETRTTDEWLPLIRAQGIAAGPVQTLDQVAQDPQVLHNKMIVEVKHPRCGPIRLLGTPVHFADQPNVSYQPPPTLGQHTEDVLKEYLGLDDQAIAVLRARKVI